MWTNQCSNTLVIFTSKMWPVCCVYILTKERLPCHNSKMALTFSLYSLCSTISCVIARELKIALLQTSISETIQTVLTCLLARSQVTSSPQWKLSIPPQFRALPRALMTAEVGSCRSRPGHIVRLGRALLWPWIVYGWAFIGHKFESVSTTRQAEGFYRITANAAVAAVVERGRDKGRP